MDVECTNCDGRGSFDAPHLSGQYAMPFQYICRDCSGTGKLQTGPGQGEQKEYQMADEKNNSNNGQGDIGVADPPGPLEERKRPDIKFTPTQQPEKASDAPPINHGTAKRVELHLQAIKGYSAFIKRGSDPVYWADRIDKETAEISEVLKNPIQS